MRTVGLKDLRTAFRLLPVLLALGTAPPAGAASPTVTAISSSLSGEHRCALLLDGSVKCWGYNGFGQLGDGTTTSSATPVQVSGLTSGVTAISVGTFESCALLNGGAVECWGDNSDGQLGDGTTTDRLTPVPVTGLASGVTAIGVGWKFGCALLAGGAVDCWGDNSDGELGDGTTTDRLTPVPVIGLTSGVTAIGVGADIGCAVIAGEAAECWGNNESGGLGIVGGARVTYARPVPVTGLTSGVTAITPGDGSATCAIVNGAAECWGSNSAGELGNGTTADSAGPVQVRGLTSGVTAITTGSGGFCALVSTGAVSCWGPNVGGLLSDPRKVVPRTVPYPLPGLGTGVTAVSGPCAIVSGGSVRCWGANHSGEVGDGTTVDRLTPVDVLWLDTPRRIFQLTVIDPPISPQRAHVSSAPGAIQCQSVCTDAFLTGTRVVLTVFPSTGFVFTGWSGACSGTKRTCVVRVTSNSTVTVHVKPVRHATRR